MTTDGGSPATRSANAQNEITSISSLTTPTYDSNGNMTGDETGKTFVYDAWNRLVAVKSGSTTLTGYQYDGENRRVSENPGTARDFCYSSNWQVLEERVGGVVDVQNVWSPVYVDAMILRDRDTDANGSLDERLWVQQDANWNVTSLVDGSGVVQERYAYDAYGSDSAYDSTYGARTSSLYDLVHLFRGRPFQSSVGIYDARGQWFSASLGRAIQLNSFQFALGDNNLYRWGGNALVNCSADADKLKPNGVAPERIDPKIGDVKYNTFRQGGTPNCWLAATVASLAYHNPDAIRKMIKDNKDGTFTVSLPGKPAVVVNPNDAAAWSSDGDGL